MIIAAVLLVSTLDPADTPAQAATRAWAECLMTYADRSAMMPEQPETIVDAAFGRCQVQEDAAGQAWLPEYGSVEATNAGMARLEHRIRGGMLDLILTRRSKAAPNN